MGEIHLARFGYSFNAGRDVYRLAEYIAISNFYLTGIDRNTDLNPLSLGGCQIKLP